MTDVQWDVWVRKNRLVTCPICGVDYPWGFDYPKHKCSERSLAAIDGQYRRDPDTEEPLNSNGAYKSRSYGQRLAEGFEMLCMSYDANDAVNSDSLYHNNGDDGDNLYNE